MTITVALIMAITMIVLLILGVPICIAIAISSILAGANALDFNMMLQTGAQPGFPLQGRPRTDSYRERRDRNCC